MLTRLVVENFRSIRQLDLPLSPLTALVGPNGCGKSTVLAALDSRAELAPTWRHEAATVRVLMTNHEGAQSRRERAPLSGTGNSGHFSLSTQALRLELRALRAENELRRADALAPDGSNLANLIATLPRDAQASLASELAARVAGIRDVDLVPTSSGRHTLRFHDRWSSATFDPDEVSDGTLLMLTFLALRYQPQRPELITIEEPERGLHPYLLGELTSFLRELTTGDRAIQVVLATHSAELLEYLKPEEVRFLARSPRDGNVECRLADTTSDDWARFYREYEDSLGGAWLSGSLGGVPRSS